MRNKGLVFKNFYLLNKEEKIRLAEKFSEGSPDLKDFLLTLWQNNVATIACCAGHKKFCPYVMIDTKDTDIIKLKHFLNHLYQEFYGRIRLGVRNHYTQKNFVRKQLCIRTWSIRGKFSKVTKCFKDVFENGKIYGNDNLFIEDIIKVLNVNLKGQKEKSTIKKLCAIGINDVYDGKITAQLKSLYGARFLNDKSKIICSPRTYYNDNGTYYTIIKGKFTVIDNGYIKKHRLNSYEELKSKTYSDYTHENFIKIINNFNL